MRQNPLGLKGRPPERTFSLSSIRKKKKETMSFSFTACSFEGNLGRSMQT